MPMSRFFLHTGVMAPDRYDLPTDYVDTPEKLAAALPHWFQANLLAVDIECSLTGVHYCVLAMLQVATHDRAWLVDPLAIPELMRPLLLAMGEVPWIVHDFSGDGIVFKRVYDVMPASVLDTMLLARALGYPQPGLKTMAKLKFGLDIPKEEQDSNWMLRPLRDTQFSYAARDAALLLPLLRSLNEEVQARLHEPDVAQRIGNLPSEMRHLMRRVRQYQSPDHPPIVDKVHGMGLGPLAEERALKLSELRLRWGNEGDVAAVMEMGNRWILARIQYPPKSKEALERSMPNPRFRRKHLDELWDLFCSKN